MGDNIIKHVGVLGMRWGIRRGKKGGKPEKKSRESSEDSVNVSQLKKKSAKELSNKELNEILVRMDLEKRFKESNTSRGKKYLRNFLAENGQNLIKNVAKSVTTEMGKQIGTKMMEQMAKQKATG